MTSFDSNTKIFSGEETPLIFHPKLPLGQAVLNQCLKHPEKVIQISYDDGLEITLEEMSRLMRAVATFLRNSGLEAGDVVGFCARNTSYLTPAVFGCVLLGLPISPIDVSLSSESMIKFYGETEPKIIFCDHDQISTIQQALKQLRNDAKIISLSDKVHGFLHISDVLATKSDSQDFPKDFGVNNDEICLAIFPSSGSTGVPKLCRVSHAQILQSNFMGVEATTHNKISLEFFHLFWSIGFWSIVRPILYLQTRIVTAQPFSAKICVEIIERFKVNYLAMLPFQIAEIVQYLYKNAGDISSVRLVQTGGSFISESTERAMESKMPKGRVSPVYGMTELGAIVALSNSNTPSSSVGQLNINTEVKILLENGTLGGIGEIGEILIRQPFNIIDYLNNERQTKAFIDEDSFVHTGDMGYFDEDLNLFFTGRKKFLISCSNHLVNPEEIEKVIVDLPGVSKVCVIAVPDHELYEAPGAVIERRNSGLLTENNIKAAVSHLEFYKQLKAVVFIDKMPLTSTGKINRNDAEKIALPRIGQA